MSNNLGTLIKNKRIENNLTQQELADMIEVSKSYINKIEHNNTKQPSLNILSGLSTALKIDYMDLIEEADYDIDDIIINQNIFNEFIYRYEASKKDIIPKYSNNKMIDINKVINDYKKGLINNIDATYLFIIWTIQNEEK